MQMGTRSPSEQENMNEEPLLGSSNSNGNKGGLRTLPFIIANEAFERMASVGMLTSMILYLTEELGMQTAPATNLLLFFSAATNFTPVLGAFLADSYVGRYPMGMFLLWLTTMIPKLSPLCYHFTDSCSSPTIAQLFLLYSSFVLMAIGAGGIRSASLPFGIDQLSYRDKESSIKESYLSWYYGSTAVSSLIAMTVIVYIQDKMGWKVGFGVPVILMFISTLSFILASASYVKLEAKKNLLSGLVQVPVASYRKRHLQLPEGDSNDIYYHGKDSKLLMPSDKLRFLNKACVIKNHLEDLTADGRASDPWNLCTVDQVEELKAIFKMVPIWISGIMLAVNMSQGSFLVLEASSMDRHITSEFQIPPGAFGTFMIVSLILCILLYDRVMIPVASWIIGRPTRLGPKQKMGVGLFSGFMSIVSLAVLESIRRKIAIEQGYSEQPKAVVKISALWLLPRLILDGMGEAFNAIGQNEFYITEMSQSMSSIASTLFGLGSCAGGLVASFILNVVDKVSSRGGNISWLSSNINKGHYDYYYWLICGLCLVNFAYFLYCSKAYGPCKVEQNKDKDECHK